VADIRCHRKVAADAAVRHKDAAAYHRRVVVVRRAATRRYRTDVKAAGEEAVQMAQEWRRIGSQAC
jgi:hypothetical protein